MSKINVGIDLGTTNSSICVMEKGVPRIVKTDTGKDTMPSCVAMNENGTVMVGDTAYNMLKRYRLDVARKWNYNVPGAYIEFKRTMGTDTIYKCEHPTTQFTSEQLSSLVLKALRDLVTTVPTHSAVITVPAKFTANQKTATLEAAKMAGFEYCELLQEPIAASYAYGLTNGVADGIWMVFDLGGGTFDAALLKVEDGIMQVFDTEGDNYLGGKDIDAMIVERFLIKYLNSTYKISGILDNKIKSRMLRNALKSYAEKLKIDLSDREECHLLSDLGQLPSDDEGHEMVLDLTVTRQQLEYKTERFYQRVIDNCLRLLERNNILPGTLGKLILVGGPTYSPQLREMLRQQVTPNVDTSVNPMTAVAVGAALYAATREDQSTASGTIAEDAIPLILGYEATTVEQTEWVSVKVGGDAPTDIIIELCRNDGAWSSGKTTVGTGGNIVEVALLPGKVNSFQVVCYDATGVNRLRCTPDSITIMHGAKVGAAPLPYNIGIAVWDNLKEKAVFKPVKGLEKNKRLPVTGQISNNITTSHLRPGIANDFITIPIYQCEDSPENGRSAELYEHVADVVITGDEVDSYIVKGSQVDLTLKVDASEQINLEAFFPQTGCIVEKKLDTSKKQSVKEAWPLVKEYFTLIKQRLITMEMQQIDVAEEEKEWQRLQAAMPTIDEPKAMLQRVKQLLRRIEEKESELEWAKAYKNLLEALSILNARQKTKGNEESMQLLKLYEQQVSVVTKWKDVDTAVQLTDKIKNLSYQLNKDDWAKDWICHLNTSFSIYDWKEGERERATQLLQEATDAMNSGASKDTLSSLVNSILRCMVEDSEKLSTNPKNLLMKS